MYPRSVEKKPAVQEERVTNYRRWWVVLLAIVLICGGVFWLVRKRHAASVPTPAAVRPQVRTPTASLTNGGVLFTQPSTGATYCEQAKSLAARLCIEQQVIAACTQWRLHAPIGSAERERWQTYERMALQGRCDGANDDESCRLLAVFSPEGSVEQQHGREKATALYKEQCDREESESVVACVRLYWHAPQESPEKEHGLARAAALYQARCDDSNAADAVSACEEIYLLAPKGSPASQRAEDRMRHLCDQENKAEACMELYRHGEATSEREHRREQTLTLLQKPCEESNELEACDRMYQLAPEHSLVEQNSLERIQQLCQREHNADACMSFVEKAPKGSPAAQQSVEQAVALYQEACDTQANARACFALTQVAPEGSVAQQHGNARYTQLTVEACAQGEATACEQSAERVSLLSVAAQEALLGPVRERCAVSPDACVALVGLYQQLGHCSEP